MKKAGTASLSVRRRRGESKENGIASGDRWSIAGGIWRELAVALG